MSPLSRLAATVSVITFALLGAASAEPLKVVASFSIIADMAKQVGGDRVALTTLVGPNGDAHVYEPKPADAAALASANVVLVNGVQLEGFLPRLVEASGAKAPIVELTKGVELLKSGEEAEHHGDGEAKDTVHDHDAKAGDEVDEAGHAKGHDKEEAGHHHGAYDPHAWQSVHNAETYVRNIETAFCAADAAGCDTYKANAAAYLATLEKLDAEVRMAIDGIPAAKRRIITSHDAFGYFAHEYGLTMLAPEGVSTEAEASAADVAALVRQVREDKASAIFVENVTNQRLIEQIASETGLKVGGELYSDALSDASGPASTYVDMVRHNVATIRGAIVGS